MNDLNSILLEGIVQSDPVIIGRGPEMDPIECSFLVRSIRYNHDYTKKISDIEIEATGNLANTCTSVLKAGRGVRIVGYLCQVLYIDQHGWTSTKIIIRAEHIEFKPEIKP
jgi:single-strand DNA-binding protein